MAGDHLIGRTLDGRYRIEALVARGGMATVYAAHDLRLRRTVAVKVMHASLAEDPGFVHRFEREAHAAAQLANPHVVAVHDQGRDADTGAIYLVMEYVVGRTVRDVLGQRGALTEVQALAVLAPVLQALAAAHDAGFVHRDVKPENVLIGDDGRIKVTDFGLARAIVSSPMSAATQGVLIGTVAYLSPEQVERGYADARSDVYGAGVLLYEMLTGQVPHSGETPLAVAFQHVHSDVPAPSLLRPGMTSIVDGIVERATRRDPDQRYQDARAFLAEVRAARAAIDASYVAPAMPDAVAAAATGTLPRATATPTATVTSTAATPATATEAEPAPRRRRRGRRWLPITLLLVALIGVGTWWATAGTHSTVPSIVGLPVADARQALQDASLTAVEDPQWSRTVPEGDVIDAQPSPGMSVLHGTTVRLIVSKGPERYAVPDITGSSPTAARAALAQVKLRLGSTSTRYSDTVVSGRIIASNPPAGQIARPGDRVDIVVSKGPAPIAVPNVVGRSAASAAAALTAAGFTPTSTTAYDDRVPAGMVARTAPIAGALVQRGTTVQTVVSKGPAPVTVPDVFRMSQQRATAVLEAAGLRVAVKRSSGRLLNLVKSQTPTAGSVVPHGTTVTITVV